MSPINLDEYFKFKIGQRVYLAHEVEHFSRVFLPHIQRDVAQKGYTTMGTLAFIERTPRALIISLRVLEECHGGVQKAYRFNNGTGMVSFFEHELTDALEPQTSGDSPAKDVEP